MVCDEIKPQALDFQKHPYTIISKHLEKNDGYQNKIFLEKINKGAVLSRTALFFVWEIHNLILNDSKSAILKFILQVLLIYE
jgi:hypothetical protein